MLPISIEELVHVYSPAVYRFAKRLTKNESLASDILQESFIKCWQQSARFDPNKSSVETWIFTITYRTAIDHLRKKSVRAKYEINEGDLLPELGSNKTGTQRRTENNTTAEQNDQDIDSIFRDLSPLPHELFESTERKEILEKTVSELRPEYRTVISLYHEADMTFKEISEITGISGNTLKSHYRRALQELREKLEQNNCTQI